MEHLQLPLGRGRGPLETPPSTFIGCPPEESHYEEGEAKGATQRYSLDVALPRGGTW